MSIAGRQVLKLCEGLRLHRYADAAGNASIGYGHKLLPSEEVGSFVRIGEEKVPFSQGLSMKDANRLLEHDLESREQAIEHLVPQDLTQGQFDALVDFVYNVGVGAFCSSGVLRRIRAGELERVPEEFKRWVYSDGKLLHGLVDRRRSEIALWEGT